MFCYLFLLLICHLPSSVNPDLSFLTILTRDHFKPPFFSITHLGFAACHEERHLCARCGGKDSKIGGTEGIAGILNRISFGNVMACGPREESKDKNLAFPRGRSCCEEGHLSLVRPASVSLSRGGNLLPTCRWQRLWCD